MNYDELVDYYRKNLEIFSIYHPDIFEEPLASKLHLKLKSGNYEGMVGFRKAYDEVKWELTLAYIDSL